jgi:signal transduction histidine kinase
MHAGLRRRLFWWFGAAIGVAAAIGMTFFHLTGRHGGPFVFVLSGAVLWIASGIIAWRLTAPLFQVIRVTREIGAGKLKSRLALGRHGGELGVLADAVNDMAARIEKQVSDQRELLAAVSHEIRTPLGHMRILLETARQRGVDSGLADDLEREVLEVDRLVAQLLAGSRLDFDAVDSRPLAAGEVAALALERAGIDHDRLEVSLDDTSFQGDPTLLARALANLLDNADRHGGGIRRVRVHAGAGADIGTIVFEVHDGGPGFAQQEVARVFDSFYRGERRGSGSLGLGLALVRRIAAAHGGRAWADNLPGGGALVAFSVRRRPAAAT